MKFELNKHFQFATAAAAVAMLVIFVGCMERRYQPAKWRAAPRANEGTTGKGNAGNSRYTDSFPEVTNWTNPRNRSGSNMYSRGGRGSSMGRRGSSMVDRGGSRGSNMNQRGSNMNQRGSNMTQRGGQWSQQRGSSMPMRSFDPSRGNRRGSSMPQRSRGSSISARFDNASHTSSNQTTTESDTVGNLITLPSYLRDGRIENPRIENPRIENPRIENPRIENPRIENPTPHVLPNLPELRSASQTTGDSNQTKNAIDYPDNPLRSKK